MSRSHAKAPTLSIVAIVAAIVGCAAPAAQESLASADTSAAPSVTASPSGAPEATAPSPTATSEPTASPAGSLAFEAPEDILPPWAFVEVAVDNLQLRARPGLSAPVVGTAPAGQRYQIFDEFGPVVVDGLDWYRLPTMGEAVIWAAAGSGADRYLELVPPVCPPDADLLLASVVLMTQWEHLACFGDRSLTFEGTHGCAGCGGTTAGDFEPGWLAFPMNFDLLWSDYGAQSGGLPLEMRIAPDSGLERPPHGAIVRVTGHFNDARSATCSMSTFEGEQATPVDSRTAELLCRERFVVDSFEIVGTDPNFP